MKRIFYLFITIMLMLQMNVFASEDEGVELKLECESLNLAKGEKATCDLNVNTISTVSVNNVSLDLESDTDLMITYNRGQFFDGSFNSGRLVLDSSDLKSGNFKLGSITITVANEATYAKKVITIKNILFMDSTNMTQYRASNVSKEVSVLSSNNNLKSISIDDKEIANYKVDTLKYDLEVDQEKIKISAELEEKDIAKVDGLGEKTLVYGKNTFEIKVTSQSGKEKIYVLNVNRKDDRSDVNTLKTLTVGDIDFTFKSNTLNYKFNVESDIDKIEIDSTLTDEKASYVDKFGNREVDLKYGENKVLIKVKSEKGTEKVYTLTINRADDRSDVAMLTFLQINDEIIELKDNVFEYEVTLPYRQEKTSVLANANEKSTIDYKDIDLKVGDNQLVIKVISEKETEKQYKIKIKRLSEEDSKAILENIEINGYNLNFTPSINTYNLEIDKNDEELEFEFFSNDLEGITYNVSGNRNLKNGSIITINVKDDLGDYVYTINIIKEVEPKLILGFLSIDILCYIVFSIGTILFICSIIYVLKLKNSKKK